MAEERWDRRIASILDCLRNATHKDLGNSEKEAYRIKREVKDKLFEDAQKSKGKLSKHLIDVILVCMDKRTRRHLEIIESIACDKDAIDWKANIDGAIEVCKKWYEPIEHPDLDNEKKKKDYLDALEKASDKLADAFEMFHIQKNVSPVWCDLIEYCCQMDKDPHYYVTYEFVHKTKFQGNDKKVAAIMDAYVALITKPDFDMPESYSKKRTTLVDIIDRVTRYMKESNNIHEYSDLLVTICEECFKHDLEETGYRPMSFWGEVLRAIVYNTWIGSSAKVMKPFMPHAMKLTKCEVDNLESLMEYIYPNMQNSAELIYPYINDVIDAWVNGKLYVISAIKGAFKEKEDEIMARFDEIAQKFDEIGPGQKYAVIQLCGDVGKKYPQIWHVGGNWKVLSSRERVLPYKDLLLESLSDFGATTLAAMALVPMVAADPKEFDDEDTISKLLAIPNANSAMVYYSNQALAALGRLNQEKAERFMKVFAEQLENPIYSQEVTTIIMAMKQLAGTEYIPVLEKYKDLILSFKDSTVAGASEIVNSVVDLLEGRTLAAVADQVADIQDDVEDLDQRVTTNEENVQQLDEKLDNQQQEIDTVKEDVKEQEERLDELEEVVDETIEKVEEIDRKTISNAPAWSRDVAKILNEDGDNNWRFLAIRLSYSPEDVRNWATAHDPTMSLLSEWYTTHKSAEATYAVLTSLKEMGRNDCAEIIEDALRAADEAIPQAPPEFTKPPPVFISYQWDHQSEVKTLKEHLENAGYECWMDIGQMGGGDKLYEKIDEGMRGAKVVLSMVTDKYSQSKNCNHEVNLASLLNKPIIPLLLEDVAWPPAGPMSVLFSQLLYINFRPENDYVEGDKFWQDSTFAELLGQINYHAAPNPEKISEEYRDWIPQVDDTPVLKPKKKAVGVEKTKEKKEGADETGICPEVFISYQWGKQPQIKRLYSRLTSLGYTCWFDIMQMGGGDALYGKIDKGIRNAKVVVSCCTKKYALSANCRREVSLADALKKPTIPLLLEGMAWPPEGPMSMPFAELLYIDFTDEELQETFEGDKFEELLQQIGVHAQLHPELLQDDSESETAAPVTGVGTAVETLTLTEEEDDASLPRNEDENDNAENDEIPALETNEAEEEEDEGTETPVVDNASLVRSDGEDDKNSETEKNGSQEFFITRDIPDDVPTPIEGEITPVETDKPPEYGSDEIMKFDNKSEDSAVESLENLAVDEEALQESKQEEYGEQNSRDHTPVQLQSDGGDGSIMITNDEIEPFSLNDPDMFGSRSPTMSNDFRKNSPTESLNAEPHGQTGDNEYADDTAGGGGRNITPESYVISEADLLSDVTDEPKESVEDKKQVDKDNQKPKSNDGTTLNSPGHDANSETSPKRQPPQNLPGEPDYPANQTNSKSASPNESNRSKMAESDNAPPPDIPVAKRSECCVIV
ncbi:uncharacterized protein [Ptychodera flava]|uniref:uncharacterized protein n=1 Tax=Ptychodera flava TaxID=63121 RepID=UPI00396AA065